MTRSNTLTEALPTSRTRKSDSDDIRLRALKRLYQRKAAVNELIDSLETYQRIQGGMPIACEPLIGLLRKCS
jgi:hypothetical protein